MLESGSWAKTIDGLLNMRGSGSCELGLALKGTFVYYRSQIGREERAVRIQNSLDGRRIFILRGRRQMVVMANPTFEASYDAWIIHHVNKSTGERKRKLLRGIDHAPKLFLRNVWWPIFGQLLDLTPEFEVRDFKDGYRYLDFAWIYNGVEIAIEIDGFGSHWRDIDRWQFDDHLFRQNDLVLDDWIVFRFSFDAIKDHPRRCQQLILHAKGKWSLETLVIPAVADPIDRAIVEFAVRTAGPFSASQAADQLGWNRVTISRHAKNLAAMGLLIPAGNSKQRNRLYKINPTFHSNCQAASKSIHRQS